MLLKIQKIRFKYQGMCQGTYYANSYNVNRNGIAKRNPRFDFLKSLKGKGYPLRIVAEWEKEVKEVR